MSRDFVNIGMVGCGLVGQRHLAALDRLADSDFPIVPRVVAIGDPSSEARQHFQQPGRREYSDPIALINDPEVELVIIGSPTRFHLDQALATMAEGKHMLLEKPVCVDTREAETLMRAANQSDSILTVGHNLRYHTGLLKAKSRLESGEIGDLLSIQTHTSSYSGLRERRPGSQGCGTFLEMSIHHFDLWRWFSGKEVEWLQAQSRDVQGADDVTMAIGRLDDGTLVSTSASQVVTPYNYVDLLGTKGRIHVCLYSFDGVDVVVGDVTPADPAHRFKRLLNSLREFPGWFRARPHGGEYLAVFYHQWEDILSCVHSGGKPRVLLEDGVAALRLSLAALQSASDGCAVEL